MKRYKLYPGHAPWNPGTLTEDPNGDWVQWEDVKEIEKLGFQAHYGYIRAKGIVTEMAVSLHQRFDINAATLRFKRKDSESLIIDVDMDIFEEFMKANLANKKEFR